MKRHTLKKKKKSVTVPSRGLLPTIYCTDPELVSQIEQLAGDRDWSVSKAAVYLMKRGLQEEGIES